MDKIKIITNDLEFYDRELKSNIARASAIESNSDKPTLVESEAMILNDSLKQLRRCVKDLLSRAKKWK